MKMSPASKGWVGLACYVLVVDIFLASRQDERYYTLSSGFENALKHPVQRWPVIVSWLVITVHLFDYFFPDRVKQFEPIGLVGRTVTNFFIKNTEDETVLQYTD